MRSEAPKALFCFQGKPLVRWVIEATQRSNCTKPPIIVVGHKAEDVRSELGPKLMYIEQTEITGTATAVKACLPYLDPDDHVLILNCDQPLVRSETVEAIESTLRQHPDALAMGVVRVEDYSDWRVTFERFGRVVRNRDGSVARIVEYADASESERGLLEINPSVFGIGARWLAMAIPEIAPSPVSGEYYLTDMVMLAADEGKRIVTIDLGPEEAFGINSIDDGHRAETVNERIHRAKQRT